MLQPWPVTAKKPVSRHAASIFTHTQCRHFSQKRQDRHMLRSAISFKFITARTSSHCTKPDQPIVRTSGACAYESVAPQIFRLFPLSSSRVPSSSTQTKGGCAHLLNEAKSRLFAIHNAAQIDTWQVKHLRCLHWALGAVDLHRSCSSGPPVLLVTHIGNGRLALPERPVTCHSRVSCHLPRCVTCLGCKAACLTRTVFQLA